MGDKFEKWVALGSVDIQAFVEENLKEVEVHFPGATVVNVGRFSVCRFAGLTSGFSVFNLSLLFRWNTVFSILFG